MKTKQLPQGWKEVELGELLDYEQPTKYIVEDTTYNEDYKTPVLTAGKSFILGHTNETSGIYNNLPVIIFDDFTTANKFVTFPFKVKSSAMKLLTSKNKDVDLKFIFLLMQTIKFSSITHKRYYLSKYQYLKIPLPPISIQKKIVKTLEQTEELKNLRKQSNKLTKNYLKSIFVEMFLKNEFPKEEIGNLILTTNNVNPKKDFPNNYFEYIDIASIDNQTKKIIEVKKVLGEDAPSRAKQQIKSKDVLVSTVRPNLNSVALVPNNLENQICSTGFCILRADNKRTISEYLFYITQLQFFISSLVKKCKGANYPAISNNDIKSLKIPLPPLPLQKKFASIVEKVEKIKEHQKQSEEEINNLFNALIQKAFRGEL